MNNSSRYKKSLSTCLALALAGWASVTSAYADWRKELGVFRIGMIESEARVLSPQEMQRIQLSFADALQMPVEIIRTRDFPALIDAQASARIEYAIYSATAYATAYLLCECIEPLVAPVSKDGATGTKTILLLDTNVKPAQIPQSKGIAILSNNSMSGYGVPLTADNFPLGKLSGKEPWLTTVQDFSTAAQLFVEGKVDGFLSQVSSNASLDSALQDHPNIANFANALPRKVEAVWISETLANGPHASRKNLPDEAKKLLSAFLIDLHQTDPDLNDLLLPNESVRFAPVDHNVYSSALSAAKIMAAHAGQP